MTGGGARGSQPAESRNLLRTPPLLSRGPAPSRATTHHSGVTLRDQDPSQSQDGLGRGQGGEAGEQGAEARQGVTAACEDPEAGSATLQCCRPAPAVGTPAALQQQLCCTRGLTLTKRRAMLSHARQKHMRRNITRAGMFALLARRHPVCRTSAFSLCSPKSTPSPVLPTARPLLPRAH